MHPGKRQRRTGPTQGNPARRPRPARGNPKAALPSRRSAARALAKHNRAVALLRQNEQHYRLLFDHNPDGVFTVDRRGRFLMVNPACETLSGYSRGELLRLTFMELCAPDQLTKAVEQFERSLRTLTHAELTTAILRRDGRRVELWVAGEALVQGAEAEAVHCTAKDITRHVQAEAALQASETRLRLAITAAGLGVLDHDLVTGAMQWDERLRELWSLAPDTPATLERFQAGLHPKDRAASDEAMRHACDPASGGRLYVEHRMMGTTPQRPVRWVSVTGQVMFAEGRAVRLVGVVRDITERKQFQNELERLVSERTAKLQELVGELEQFSYSIVHDMRAPLRSIRGFAELCAQKTGPEQQNYLRRIETATDRMDALITDALSYNQAVRQELALERIDLGALLQGLLDSYPQLTPYRERIQLAGDLPQVLGNAAALTQCFSSLLDNAVKFVAAGREPEVRVWSEARDGWVRIWVEDHGIGIPPNMRPWIFRLFCRGHKGYPGNGIGLALVRKVVDRMGGHVGVESEPDQGSRFWVELRPGAADAALT